jgi:hydrogenase-4 component B
MTSIWIALAVLVSGALLALISNRNPARASAIGAGAAVIGSAIGLWSAIDVLLTASEANVIYGEEVLFGGRLIAGIDPLSAFFLTPIFGLGGLTAIYGRPYLLAWSDKKWLGPPWFSFNMLLASMSAVVLARDGLGLLVAWEAMSLSAYSLVSFEHEIESSRRAGWIYLLASHVALALLAFMFLTASRSSGDLEFSSISSATFGTGASTAIFLLALAGFGIKSGLVPFHVWLPEAHAAAPSHVSAMMSGVLIKMGVYGLLRMLSVLPAHAWWGPLLMIFGVVTGIVGITLAISERDLKRALAYSSVENIGVVFLGIGLGMFALSKGRPEIAWLGFAGGLFHVWNHAMMKGLLFLSAGSILHGAGTKDIEQLGGLLKKMPATGVLMIFGAVAISALPPLNGFVSEWLIYLGLMRGKSITLMFSVGLLALIGCLASFCFIRLIGIVFLGAPRSGRVEHAHESPRSMLAPMFALVALSATFAIVPSLALAPISGVLARMMNLAPAGADANLLGAIDGAILVIVLLTSLLLARLIARRGVTADSTWGCGYAAPTARMQYTGGSFSELLASRLIPRAMRPRISEPTLSLFADKAAFSSEIRDPLTRGVYEPFFSRMAGRLTRLRWMQQGVLHIYIAYILVVLVLALGWMSLRTWGVR